MNKCKLLLLVCLCYGSKSIAQNAFGALHSNFTPTNSLYLNPSSMLDSKVWLDINIVGAGVYVNNDLVNLNNHSLISLLMGATVLDTDLDYNQNQKKYHAYNRNFVAAPSVVWNQGDHAAGLSIGARSYTGARNVPDYIARFIENGVPEFDAQHDIDYSAENLRVASINFSEIKLSYGYTFLKKGRNMFMGGITVSKFFSLAGGGANIYNFDFNVDNDSLISIENIETDLMMTPEIVFNAKGGIGLDIGFTFQKMLGDATGYYPHSPKSGCRELGYKYKLGLSIVDIGSVKFSTEDILYAGYNFDSYNWENYVDSEVNEENPLDLFASQERNITEGNVRKPNKVRLPTFVSGQFDYNIWDSKVYVNATVIQGVPVSKNKFGLRHANSLSITPRYESYLIDFALPISLYEYRYPQLGASLRVGPLTLGTDKLINWFKKSNIYGADIYVYLKVPIKYSPSCKDRSKGNRSRGRKGRSRFKSPTDCTL